MKRVIILTILMIALIFLRIFVLKNIGLTDTEDLLTYRSWALSVFGVDEFGRHYPLFFGNKLGIQMPLLSYLSIPLIKIFGSSFSAQIILDNFYWLLPLSTALIVGYRYLFVFFLMINPVFFWPGAWEQKVLTTQVLILFVLLKQQRLNLLLIVFIVLLAIFTSIDAWFLFPVTLTVMAVYRKSRRLEKWESVLVLAGLSLVFVFILFNNQKASLQLLQKNYWGIFSDIGIVNSINSLRGEDLQYGIEPLAKFFHNKTQFIPVYLSQSFSYFNPSFLFVTGDNNEYSNNFFVSPILTIFIVLLTYSLITLKKKNIYLLLWLFLVVLILGLDQFPQTEKNIYLLTIPLFLLIDTTTRRIPHKIIHAILLLSFLNLLIVVLFSASLASRYQLNCSRLSLVKIVDLARNNLDNKIYLSDDVCSNPGPGLALIMSIDPPRQPEQNYAWKYLRQINNITIVSPNDLPLTTISQEEIDSNRLNIRLVSEGVSKRSLVYNKNKMIKLKSEDFYVDLTGETRLWRQDSYDK